MDLCYCEMCRKWFSSDDTYDEILIAEKSGEVYRARHFCQECGKKIHDVITVAIKESEDSDNE